MKKRSFSLILCTRNRQNEVCALLKNLRLQTHMPDQIIVVDSSDIPLTQDSQFKRAFSTDCYSTIILKYLHTKPGLTLQRNCGIAHATGDIVYFLDDDVTLDPHYFETMQRVFETKPEFAGGMGAIGTVGVRDPWYYRALKRVFMLQRDDGDGCFTHSGMPQHPYHHKTFKEVELLNGCGAYRRAVFQRYRFDEKLGGYAAMEDCDFSYRASREHKLFYEPRAVVYHHETQTSRDPVVLNRAMYLRNYSYLFFKNFYPYYRLRVICFCWTVLGLFVQALLWRRFDYVCGYASGLLQVFKEI